MEQRLMNVKELSSYLSMPAATIYAYVGRGRIPQGCIRRIGRALKFDRPAIDLWISGGTSDTLEVSFQPSRKETFPTSGPGRQGAA